MTSNKTLKLGTRGSDLAMTQSTTIANALKQHGTEVELQVIKTAGDQSDAPSFAAIGPQGVFVREIEQALLNGAIDLAVHSFKDLPTQSPEQLIIGAVPERYDAKDIILIRNSALDTSDNFIPVDKRARIGTSSARRQAWLRHFRHDLHIEPLRGNVPTRLAHLRDGKYDAIILASAGIERLREVEELLDSLLVDITAFPLDPARFVPAPAQGALAVQCREGDVRVIELLEKIDDAPSRICVEAEREALREADGGCEVAFGAHCTKRGDQYQLTCMLERNDQVHSVQLLKAQPENLGAEAWRDLKRKFSGA